MAPIRNYQQRPALQTLFSHYPHPRCGQGFWYAHEFRQAVMFALDIGHTNDTVIQILREQKLWPSHRTTRRWDKRLQTLGNLMNYPRTGNKRATVLRGVETFKLAWLMAVFPRINAAEINVFLYNSNGQIRFYSPSQIYRTQDRIGLSKKRSSTTVMQATLPINIQRRWSFWNLP